MEAGPGPAPAPAPFLNDRPRRLWEAGRAAPVPLLLALARGEGLQTLAPWPNGGEHQPGARNALYAESSLFVVRG